MRDYSRMTSWTHVDFLLAFASPKPSIWKCTLEFNLMNELSCSTKLFPRSASQTTFVHFVDPSSSTIIQGSAVWFQISPIVRALPNGRTMSPIVHGPSWPSPCLLNLFCTPGPFSVHNTVPHICVFVHIVSSSLKAVSSLQSGKSYLFFIFFFNSSKWCIFWKS